MTWSDRDGAAFLSTLPAQRGNRQAAAAVALVTLLVFCTAVPFAQVLLPPIMAGSHYTPLMRGIVTSVWLISLAALIVVWRRRQRSVLHLWLAVVMLVWLIDIALSAMLNAGRFDLGFCAGRLYGLLANSVVLMILMVENAGIHARLLAATTELQAANQELDTFAQAVSHDLRAPLRAMSGFSAALAEDYGGLQRDRVDLNEVVDRIRAELGRAGPGRAVQGQVAPAMSIDGDPRMVDVVMRNLLGNAWKYTARTDRAAIRVYAEGPAGAACICLHDNGAGFDMARAGQLFQPFQRLHRQDEFPGHGIGLATVQRIVQRHGGGIPRGVGAGPRRDLQLPVRRRTARGGRLSRAAPQGDDGRC